MYREKMAQLVYDLFVVNTHAAAVQQPNGLYYTKYFPLDASILAEMYKMNGSMGCYQQTYGTNMIRWICLDYDCENKNTPDLYCLFKDVIKPITNRLKELDISYLTEFSGRRGIHIWIIFDTLFPKALGYEVLHSIVDNITFPESEIKYHGDFFPATDSARTNKVGKMVKFPLSSHMMGQRSFFFVEEFEYIEDTSSEIFFEMQHSILSDYKSNDIDLVCQKLKVAFDESRYYKKYQKYKIMNECEASVEDVIQILSETKVFNEIFGRLRLGQAKRDDWRVLLGTLGHIDNHSNLLKAVLEYFPNYDYDKTKQNIDKWANAYFPATFRYLYKIYGIELEDGLDPDSTGLIYLLNRLGCSAEEIDSVSDYNEKRGIVDIDITLNKEIKYFSDNDEVPDVYIWNSLQELSKYDLSVISEVISNIEQNRFPEIEISDEYRVFTRIESPGKNRRLVSLSARDRVLTTHLALKIAYTINKRWDSFSYHPFFSSQREIFYNWYTAWGNYIEKIKTFLEIPFMNNHSVMVLDIKGFYDNIDFLSVSRRLSEELSEINNRYFQFLLNYNEKLMRKINEGERKGVPQGPAYARIIAELYLDRILQTAKGKIDKQFQMYRYVDDIIIFYPEENDGAEIYRIIESELLDNGMNLNTEKSCIFGKISDLSEDNIGTILRKDKFDYELQFGDTSRVVFQSEKRNIMKRYLNEHPFDSRSMGFIFGSKSDEIATLCYFLQYGKEMFESSEGRGSYFSRFYRYLFSHKEMLELAIYLDYFDLIPRNTVNYQNCIHTLYLMTQSNKLNYEELVIILPILSKHIEESIDNKDVSVIDALNMYVEQGELV